MSLKPTPKVTAASATSVVTGLVVTYVLKGANPSMVELFVSPLVIGAATLAAGWLKRHGK